MMRIKYVLLICMLLACTLVGCNRGRPKPPGFPKLVSAQITIMQEGKPLEKAFVQLHPEGDAQDWGTTGTTDAAGLAALYTGGFWKGVPLGNYKVTVTKIVTEESKLVEPPMSDSEAYQKYEAKKAGERLATHSFVDNKFGDVASTPLTLNVTGSTTETLDVGTATKTQVIDTGN